jgi:hypothetical protein
MSSLKLAFCDSKACQYAVDHWHYSKSLPPPPRVSFGVWEDDTFKGAVIFARGASTNLLKPYGLKCTEGAELVRVALKQHDAPVSRILSIAVKLLKKQCPGLRLLVSFADPAEGHVGGIYQASNWIYAGQSAASHKYKDKSGKIWHERMISKRGVQKVFGEWRKVLTPSDCEIIPCPGKYRYLLPLDSEMAKQITPLAKPYPKCLDNSADQVLAAAQVTTSD